MLSMHVNLDGVWQPISCDQYFQLFDSLKITIPTTECYRDDIGTSGSGLILPFEISMDRTNKKSEEGRLPSMPQILVNNPNLSISVYPTPPKKSSPVSTVNKVSRVAVSVVKSNTIINQDKKLSPLKCCNATEVKNSKRVASCPIGTRPVKLPRLSISKTPKILKEKKDVLKSPEKVSESNLIKNNKSKKEYIPQTAVKIPSITSATTSSVAVHRVPLESTSPRPTKQSSNVDLNCKVDSTNVDVEDGRCGPFYQFKTDGLTISNKKDLNSKNNVLQVTLNGEMFEITNPPLLDDMVVHLCKSVKKYASNEEFEQIKTTSRVIKSPEHDRSPEPKDVSSVNSKTNQINQNIITSTKTQSISQVNSKSRLPSNQQQQSCSSKQSVSTTQPPNSTKQNNIVTTPSSKTQLPNKQNELKEIQISSSNQNSALLKLPAVTATAVSQNTSANKVVTGIQSQPSSSNKQQINSSQQQPSVANKISLSNHQVSPTPKQTIGNQQQTSPVNNKHTFGNQHQLSSVNKQNITNQQQPSKLPVVSVTELQSVTKQLNNQSSSGKSLILSQALTTETKKCSKCKAVTEEDDVCTTCRMSSQLKGVTVTRIETPGTQRPPTPVDDNVIQLLSSDEDDDDTVLSKSQSVEPIIYKTESQELLRKHIDKLKANPTILEDKLWQKDLSSEDYFKFGQCRAIQIGTFNTVPASSDGLVICIHGIRMTVQDLDHLEPVTIDIHIDNIVKILGFYAEKVTTLFIYTNYLAAYGIQHLLNMKENNKEFYYDPLSSDKLQRKIVWSVDLTKLELKRLEKFLLKFKDKYDHLTKNQVNDILFSKNFESEDSKYGSDTVKFDDLKYEDTVIIGNKLYGRPIPPVKIIDYRVLQVEEFLNDIIMEFYLNWLYVCKLTSDDQNRTYLFNSFFYTQLTKITSSTTSESKAKTRHNRVKKWTKNVNVFEKDFIVIPINESYHWFLAVICFPYLSGPVYFDDGKPAKISNDKPDRPYHPPIDSVNSQTDEADGSIEDPWEFEISYGNSNKNTGSYETDVENLRKENRRPIKQPCILIFDSLNGGVSRARIVATLREWLAEEYKSKHDGVEKDFSPAVMKGSIVKVPQQPNSVDCGLFVFHYVEKFFKCPIVDYHFPITHLENWFPASEVTKNCQKRKEVQNTIMSIIEERGGLPYGITLPTLNFTQQSQHRSHNHSSYPNHYYGGGSDEEIDDEGDDEIDDERDEGDEEDYNDEEEYVEGNYSYPEEEGYAEYPELDDELSDNREFYGEMVGNEEEWSHEQHGHDDDAEDYNDEHHYNEEDEGDEDQYQMHQSENDNNIVVDVDDLHTNHHRNLINRQHISSDTLRSFRMNHHRSYRRHHNEDDDNHVNDHDVDDDDNNDNGDDNNVEEEEVHENVVVNPLPSLSKKRHFNQR